MVRDYEKETLCSGRAAFCGWPGAVGLLGELFDSINAQHERGSGRSLHEQVIGRSGGAPGQCQTSRAGVTPGLFFLPQAPLAKAVGGR
jgi:hypothetical protein